VGFTIAQKTQQSTYHHNGIKVLPLKGGIHKAQSKTSDKRSKKGSNTLLQGFLATLPKRTILVDPTTMDLRALVPIQSLSKWEQKERRREEKGHPFIFFEDPLHLPKVANFPRFLTSKTYAT